MKGSLIQSERFVLKSNIASAVHHKWCALLKTSVIPLKYHLINIYFSLLGPWVTRNSSIDSGEAEVGRRVTQEVPPGVFWRSQIHISQPQFLKFNISLGKDALFGVYIRRGLPPSHAQVLHEYT